jgi:hypothetical protein
MVRAVQELVTPKQVSRTKRYVSTEYWRFALVKIPEIKLMYRAEALIHGANASELVGTPAVSGPIKVVAGAHPSGAVAPKQVSRRKIFVFDLEVSATRSEALD